MSNQNSNENLTPDELVEKLKEKLAIDRDTYSQIVDSSVEDASVEDILDFSGDDGEEQAVLEIDGDEVLVDVYEAVADDATDTDQDSVVTNEHTQDEAQPEVADVTDDVASSSTVDQGSDEQDESDMGEYIAVFEQTGEVDVPKDLQMVADTDGIEEIEELYDTDIYAQQTSSSEISESETQNEDYVDQRIAEMLAEITSEDAEEQDDSMKKTESDAQIDDESAEALEDVVDNSTTTEVETADSTTVFDARNNDGTKEIRIEGQDNSQEKKPTVYRFRRYDPNQNSETKLHGAVAVDDEGVQTDALEKTKLNEVPELERPDLDVMQTFGASVEHVRELYGDDVADEYEKMLSVSDFNERLAVEHEYTSVEQSDSIIESFEQKLSKNKIKIGLCAVLTVLILLLENLSLLGVRFSGILDQQAYPVSFIMLDLQLLVLCAALAFPVLKKGTMDIIALEPSSKSITLAVFVVAFAVSIASCFMDGGVLLYNFSAAMAMLFSLIYESKMIKRDYMTFKILSSEKVKSSAVVSIGTSKSPEVAAYEQLDEDEEVKLINIRKGSFVKDFFARTKQPDSSAQDKILLPLTVCVMIVLFIISLVMHKDSSQALKIAHMSFSAFVPFAVYFSLIFPVSNASESLYESGSAIIGDAALEEYSGASIVCFEDRDVFPSYCVKLKSVKVYGESRIDRVLYNASSVFSKIGGPLADVFALSTIEIGTSEDIDIVLCKDDGIEAMVDGKRVLIGRSSFLAGYGIYARKDESDDNKYAHLYITEGEFLSAKFYIKYDLDVDFENVITRMSGCGICGVLKTFDPNIDDALLSKFIDTKKYPIRVVKCKTGDDIVSVLEEVNSGVVSINGAKNTVNATVTCERLYNIRCSSNTVKILSMVIGMILCTFMTLFNVSPLCSAFVVLYQLLWMIPNIISSRLYLNR